LIEEREPCSLPWSWPGKGNFDEMTFAHDVYLDYGFCACDPFEHITCFMSFDWLKDVAQLTYKSQLIYFTG